jgi:hypothetical protein
MLSFQELSSAFEQTPLFESKTWRLSPDAFPLEADQLSAIEAIGQACFHFHRALETLYLRSAAGKNLLRNQRLEAPWVAPYLDRGKPCSLVEHGREEGLKGKTPLILRPDLLITDDGFALTELDAVPGGIGLTAFLNGLYAADAASETPVIGSKSGMIEAFFDALAASVSPRSFPFIAILVSDEAATYRPEMEWLARELQLQGKRVFVFHPNELIPISGSLCVSMDGSPQKVDIIYRFWELFDHRSIRQMPALLASWKEGEVSVTPPMRPFQEEKLALALFHHPQLLPFWEEQLERKELALLRRTIPMSWIVDPSPLPPCAFLHAPTVGGRPLHHWSELGEASKKERDLILKISGFDESAWGARSVTLGSDVSREEWVKALQNAVSSANSSFYILQEYRKPKRVRHPVYRSDGVAAPADGRVRLCPYYFVKGEKVELQGILATFCPSDKKIIHGMKDAALIPCRIAASSQ